jgi:hypothetical protein
MVNGEEGGGRDEEGRDEERSLSVSQILALPLGDEGLETVREIILDCLVAHTDGVGGTEGLGEEGRKNGKEKGRRREEGGRGGRGRERGKEGYT